MEVSMRNIITIFVIKGSECFHEKHYNHEKHYKLLHRQSVHKQAMNVSKTNIVTIFISKAFVNKQ